MENTIEVGDTVKVTKPSLKSFGRVGTVTSLNTLYKQARVEFPNRCSSLFRSTSLRLLDEKKAPHKFKVGDWAVINYKSIDRSMIGVYGQIDKIGHGMATFNVPKGNYLTGAYTLPLWKLNPCEAPIPPTTLNTKNRKFIIWNPLSLKPPITVIDGYELAKKTAEGMANRFNEEFYVCELKGKAKTTSAKYEAL